MGYVLPEVYQSLCSQLSQKLPKVFIETGTYMGGIPHRMLDENKSLNPFEKIYTIELGEDIAKVASKRYKLFEEHNCDSNLFNAHTTEKDESFSGSQTYFDGRETLINGESSVELEKLLKTIDEPCCFWLDAHAGASKFARGDVDVPLLKELEVIKKHHIKNHVITIDDAHLFGETHNDSSGNILCDYTTIQKDVVEKALKDINKDYLVNYGSPYGSLMLAAGVENKIEGSTWWNK